MSNPKKYKYLFALVGIALFAFILLNINTARLLQLLSSANPSLLLAGVVLVIIATALKALKWQTIIFAHSFKLPLAKTLEYFFAGFGIGMLTPGRVGELLRALYLNKHSKNLGLSVSTVVLDRIIDAGVLLAIGVIALVSFNFMYGKEIVPLWLSALAMVCFIAVLALFLKKSFVARLLKPLFNLFVPERHKQLARDSFQEFYSQMFSALKKKTLLIASILVCALSWVLLISGAYLLLLSLGAELPAYLLFLAIPIISILDVLPITIFGIGTRDAVLIFMFSFFGIAAEQAIAFSFLYLLAVYWLFILIGAAFFSKNPIRLGGVL